MSEYQYYEFRTVGRKLTRDEMREMRAVSTRAEITPTSFTNEYSWGNFKGNPTAWMERYFDGFLYLANWGTREVMLRVPAGALDPDLAHRYCPGEFAEVEARGGWLIFRFRSEDEGDEEWLEPQGTLPTLLPLLGEIESGDLRPLYLGWLGAAWMRGVDEDEDAEVEPPVPPGLDDLTHAQRTFAEFLRISPDLIAAAAERSTPPKEADAAALRDWIASLPAGRAADLLARVAAGEGPRVQAEVLRGFRDARGREEEPEPRTVAELLALAEIHEARRLRREREEEARAQARREREEAAERERRLAALAGREDEEWSRVEALIEEKNADAYDQAVRLIGDLRELAARDGRAGEADRRIRDLRARHAPKRNFVKQLVERMGR